MELLKYAKDDGHATNASLLFFRAVKKKACGGLFIFAGWTHETTPVIRGNNCVNNLCRLL